MPFKESIWLDIGLSSYATYLAGNLRARLISEIGVVVIPSAGNDVDPATGYIHHDDTALLAKFVPRGTKGKFLFTFYRFPDNFSGGLEVFDITTPTEVIGGGAINPGELEYVNARLSDFVFSGAPGAAPGQLIAVNIGGGIVPIVNLEMVRGQSITWTLQLPNTYDMTNWAIFFTAKYDYDEPDPGEFQKTRSNGITVNPSGRGVYYADITLTPSDTSNLDTSRPLHYDIKIASTPGVDQYLFRGEITMDENATKTTG